MKKKILFILHFPPPVHGSAIVGQVIKNSSIINQSFDCRYINLLVSRTVDETGKPSWIKVFRFIALWFNILIETIRNKPDLCYLALTSSGAAFYKDVFIVAVMRCFRVKRVYHMHNQGVRQNETKLINRLLYRFVFNGADVILLSNQLYKDVASFVPKPAIHVCANGIADTTIEAGINKKTAQKPFKILFLSNLLLLKGVYELLEACSILQQKGIDFECYLVGAEGDISASQFTDKVIQKQLTHKVHYLGKKFGAEKEEIFAIADIFVHPTLNDCFPLVLLEAMRASLPIVSTFEGGIPDIVNDGVTGFLVPKRDAHLLAEKIERLIEDTELCQSMGKQGRIKYENEFTVKTFESKLNSILNEIITKQDN
jgi:Glycosyltransferase